MLSSIIRWNVTRTKLFKFYGSLACNNYTLVANQCPSKQSILQCITLKHNIILHRNYWNLDKDVRVFLPLFPGNVIRDRSLLSTVLLIIQEQMPMKSSIDEDFNLVTVTAAAKRAASKVSIELAKQNYDELKDLVEDTMLKMLQVRIDSLTAEQKKLIAMQEEDILFSKASHLDITLLPTGSGKDYTVELGLIIAYLPLYDTMKEENDGDFNIFTPPILPLVANYIFRRDYRSDGNTDWKITFINIAT